MKPLPTTHGGSNDETNEWLHRHALGVTMQLASTPISSFKGTWTGLRLWSTALTASRLTADKKNATYISEHVAEFSSESDWQSSQHGLHIFARLGSEAAKSGSVSLKKTPLQHNQSL
jgi:hypothetical protein